ncbi:hypothetical protein DIPPA_25343 [Diplonema papillatum]|nr:hypothetical protein DIPPA_25343 [Diplonema papillatum]
MRAGGRGWRVGVVVFCLLAASLVAAASSGLVYISVRWVRESGDYAGEAGDIAAGLARAAHGARLEAVGARVSAAAALAAAFAESAGRTVSTAYSGETALLLSRQLSALNQLIAGGADAGSAHVLYSDAFGASHAFVFSPGPFVGVPDDGQLRFVHLYRSGTSVLGEYTSGNTSDGNATWTPIDAAALPGDGVLDPGIRRLQAAAGGSGVSVQHARLACAGPFGVSVVVLAGFPACGAGGGCVFAVGVPARAFDAVLAAAAAALHDDAEVALVDRLTLASISSSVDNNATAGPPASCAGDAVVLVADLPDAMYLPAAARAATLGVGTGWSIPLTGDEPHAFDVLVDGEGVDGSSVAVMAQAHLVSWGPGSPAAWVLLSAVPRRGVLAAHDDRASAAEDAAWAGVAGGFVIAACVAALLLLANSLLFNKVLSEYVLTIKRMELSTWEGIEQVAVAVMQEKPSLFAEMEASRAALLSLCTQLLRVRDFVPAACLRAGEDSDDAEDGNMGETPLPLPPSPTASEMSFHSDRSHTSEDRESMQPSTRITSPTLSSAAGTPAFVKDSLASAARSVSPALETLKKRDATLMEGALRHVLLFAKKKDPQDLLAAHGLLVAQVYAAIAPKRAAVDFRGDLVYAAFSRVGHRVEAMSCACEVQGLVNQLVLPQFRSRWGTPINPAICFGIATGVSLCGNLGCDGLKRYGYLGGIPIWTHIVQQLACKWQVPILVDDAVHRDASVLFVTRLHDRVVFPKRGTNAPVLLWEIISGQVMGGASADNPQEWMYALQQEKNPWDLLNKALVKHWDGAHLEALDALQRHAAAATSEQDAAKAVPADSLRARLLAEVEHAISRRLGPVAPLHVSDLGITVSGYRSIFDSNRFGPQPTDISSSSWSEECRRYSRRASSVLPLHRPRVAPAAAGSFSTTSSFSSGAAVSAHKHLPHNPLASPRTPAIAMMSLNSP